MALTNCPSCGKKISDKAEACQHCGFSLGSATAEDIARKQSLNKYLKSQNLQMQSLIAIVLFVAGFAFMYWGDATPGELQYNIAIGLTILGFIWYIVNRVRLVFLRRTD